MKLRQEQINYLFSYCSEQGIIHYDVQIEMVDHFAEWIELNWEKQPDANFMNMLEQAKKAIPDNELKDIITQKEKFLKKELTGHYHQEILSFFTVPKIALSVLLVAIFYAIPWDPEKDITQHFSIFILITNFYTLYLVLWRGKNIIVKNKDEKMFPLLQYEKLIWLGKVVFISHSCFFLIFYSSFFFDFKTTNQYLIYTIKTMLPFMIISIVSWYYVQVKINKKIRELYPTAFANN